MLVSACMPCGPRCLRWILLMLSGPHADEFLRLLMICFVWPYVKGA